MKRRQGELFGNAETMPLFSGTAVRALAEQFTPTPAARNLEMFECPICKGTGVVRPKKGGKAVLCPCPASKALRG